MSDYFDYPTEPIGGGNPYYRCCACGASDPQVNGRLEGHFKGCSWVARKIQSMKTGIEQIADERARQVSSEGWTVAHDDKHTDSELVLAAESYLRSSSIPGGWKSDYPPRTWPFESEAWKPSGDTIRDLVKAGALIAAEIDRRQRLSNEA